MSTIFDVPCPGCGRQMGVRQDGDVQCTTCHTRYHTRLGYLVPTDAGDEADAAAREVSGASLEPS